MTNYIEGYLPFIQYHGFNTQKNVTLAGAANFDASGSTGTFAFPSGGVSGLKNVPVASGGTTRTLTAAQSGSVNLFDSAAGITYTLPAPAAGLTFDFITTVLQTSSNHVVVTNAGTVFLLGAIAMFSGEDVTPSSTLGPKMYAANGTTHIKYTSNGTTTGGGIGTWLRLTCLSSTQWFVSGVVKSPSGSLATPFST